MKTHLLLTAALTAAAALLPTGLAAAPAADAADTAAAKQVARSISPVTSNGFDRHVFDASLYIEIPMQGLFGTDVHKESVLQTLRMAAADPNIHHVVYLIDGKRGGQLFDKDVVGTHQDDLEVHAIVKDAMTTTMFPVFFCDSVFVVNGSRIGGLPLAQYYPPGSEEVLAKWIGITSSQLESAADAHGHDSAIVRAMLGQDDSLHFWRDRGEVHISTSAPPSLDDVEDYDHITPLIPGGAVILDHEQAVKLELAEMIDEFDSLWVGEKIGAHNWTPANRFGHVSTQIAKVASGLKEYQDLLDGLDRNLPTIRRNRANRGNRQLQMLNTAKRNLENGVSSIDTITQSIDALYDVHPERHVYFAGPNNTTILADPEQWAQDVRLAKMLVTRIRSGLNTLRSTVAQLDTVQLLFPGFNLINPANLDQYIEALEEISEQLDGINRHGNAHYWDDIYEQPLPPDEYRVTYG